MYVEVYCKRLGQVDFGVVVGLQVGTKDAKQNRVAVVQSSKDDGAGYGVVSVSVNEAFDMSKTADVIVAGLDDIGHMITMVK